MPSWRFFPGKNRQLSQPVLFHSEILVIDLELTANTGSCQHISSLNECRKLDYLYTTVLESYISFAVRPCARIHK